MAPKSAKRAAPKQQAAKGKASPAKRAKKVDPMLAAVQEIVTAAQGLPDAARSMLSVMLEATIMVPQDQRSKLQARVVEMVGEVCDGVVADMAGEVAAAEEHIAQLEGGMAGLGAKVAEASSALEKEKAVVCAKATEVSQCAGRVLNAKTALAEAQRLQAVGDTPLVAVRKERDDLEIGISSHLKALRDGDWETTGARQHLMALMPLTQAAGLDDSLASAIPSSCTKPPGMRSNFDGMVFEQLEAKLKERLVTLSASLDRGAAAEADRAEAVRTADEELKRREEAERLASLDLRAAQAAEREALAGLAAADQAHSTAGVDVAQAKDLVEARRASAEHFSSWNVSSLELLRDRLSKPSAHVEALATASVSEAAAVGQDATADAPPGDTDMTPAEL